MTIRTALDAFLTHADEVVIESEAETAEQKHNLVDNETQRDASFPGWRHQRTGI